jgi:hypothetical protein
VEAMSRQRRFVAVLFVAVFALTTLAYYMSIHNEQWTLGIIQTQITHKSVMQTTIDDYVRRVIQKRRDSGTSQLCDDHNKVRLCFGITLFTVADGYIHNCK